MKTNTVEGFSRLRGLAAKRMLSISGKIKGRVEEQKLSCGEIIKKGAYILRGLIEV
jgi:hypothetical protein